MFLYLLLPQAIFELCVLCWTVCFCFGIFVYVLWLQLPIYLIVFWHPGRPVGGKHNVLVPWKPANKLGQHPSKELYDQRNIKTQINQLIILQYKDHYLSLSIALIPLACPQSGNLPEHCVWGGGGGRNNIFNLDCSNHFNWYNCQYYILQL